MLSCPVLFTLKFNLCRRSSCFSGQCCSRTRLPGHVAWSLFPPPSLQLGFSDFENCFRCWIALLYGGNNFSRHVLDLRLGQSSYWAANNRRCGPLTSTSPSNIRCSFESSVLFERSFAKFPSSPLCSPVKYEDVLRNFRKYSVIGGRYFGTR